VRARLIVSSSQRQFRPDVEGLRAVAVIAVVLSHASLGVRGGYVGVDVFFVISGFLITRLLLQEADRKGRFSFAAFYARRARRIVPAATLVTVATLLGAYVWAPPLRFGAIARDGLASALFGVNWRLAAQGTNYFQASSPPSPFQHFWSLSVEEQFYLGWPLLLAAVLFVVRTKQHRTKVVTLTAVLAAVIGVSLWASIRVTHESAPYGYFGTHTRVWELAVGAIVAATAETLRRLPRSIAAGLAWLGLAAIVLACLAYSSATAYPGFAATLPVGGAALIIIAGCGAAPRWGPERLLTVWPMRWTGRISYSLYLWHWPLLVLLPDAAGHPLTIPERLCAIAAAVALSVLTYLFVEQPFLRQRILVARPVRGLALGTGLVVASVVTALVLPSLITLPGGKVAAPAALALPPPTSGASPANAGTATIPAASTAAASSAPVASAVASTPPGLMPVSSIPAVPADPKLDAAEVQAALATAATQQALPPTVQSLTQAAVDYPNSGGCEVNDTAETPKLPCNGFGDPQGTTQVVLIGDSHAGMWLGAINSIAAANHWKLAFFAKSGCPLGDYPDFVNPSLKRTYTECNLWRSAAIAQVVSLNPALVIVGSQERDIAGSEPTGLEESIKGLEAGGAKVVFLGDTPSPAEEGSVPDCLSEHPSDIESCNIPRTEAALTSVARQTEIAGAKKAGATVIDPTPWFCTTTVCPAVVQNVIVYEDNSHITSTYALLRAPELLRQLTEVLDRPSANAHLR
jgi:peptidoglycan/LPS O-acetylase OafA/YrhL